MGADQPRDRERTVTSRHTVRRILRFMATIAAVTYLLNAQIAGQKEASYKVATVSIVPICGIQTEFRRCRLEVASFKEQVGNSDLANCFWLGSGSGVPYGTYDATFYFADAWPVVPIRRTITVSQPDVRWVIDLRPRLSGAMPYSPDSLQ